MKKGAKFYPVLLLSSVLLLNSCYKEIHNSVNNRVKAPDELLASAKLLYARHTDTAGRPTNLTPRWQGSWLVHTAESNTILVVPEPERPVSTNPINSPDIFSRRFFIFQTGGNDVTEGRILTLMGRSYNVDDNLDHLLKNYRQKVIKGYNGSVLQYDLSYKPVDLVNYQDGHIHGTILPGGTVTMKYGEMLEMIAAQKAAADSAKRANEKK